MTYGLERQRWLAAIALAAAVPLPFTGVTSVPFLLPYVAAACVLLVARRPLAPLPPWLENVLAPAIVVAVVAAGGGYRYGVLRPVAQLAALVAAVRLPGGAQRGRTGTAIGLLMLIGVAGIASSTHVLLVPYLVCLLVLVMVAAGRTVALGFLEAERKPPGSAATPPVRLIVTTAVLGCLLAIPIFVFFPRLRSPFATAGFGARSVSGFRDAVSLHGIGDIKRSHEVALRVRFQAVENPSADWLRLVGATLQHYRAGNWAEGRLPEQTILPAVGRAVQVSERRPGARLRRIEITLERESDVLFLPPGTVSFTPPTAVRILRERLGVMRIPRGTEVPVQYSAEFDPDAIAQRPPEDADTSLPPDSEEIAQLARQVTSASRGETASAAAIEEHLRRNLKYSTGAFIPLRADPVKYFLTSGREGHCELFASGMTMMLRSLGIPARVQAGYLGGEPEGDGAFRVRSNHAHAWVVAFVDGAWRIFDPTPAEGRPGLDARLGTLGLGELWGRTQEAWDRWILTFSLSDQVDLLRRVLDAARATWRTIALVVAALAALAALIAITRLVLRRRDMAGPSRRVRGIAGALGRVAEVARARGLATRASLTPRALHGALAERAPQVRESLDWLVREHERCRYAGGAPPSRRAIAHAARHIIAGLRRAGAAGSRL